MGFRILGAASATPSFSADQTTLTEFAADRCCTSEDRRRVLSALYRRTRVQARGSILMEETGGQVSDAFYRVPAGIEDRGPSTRARMQEYEKFAGEMAVRAGRKALERSRVEPEEISHLITVSCTGFHAPGVDSYVMTRLGLVPGVERSQLGFMGCQAMLNALRLARAFVDADPASRVLIASVELCSLHFQYGWDPERVVSNALFADGAGAVVGAHGAPGQAGSTDWIAVASGSHLVPDSGDAMTWRIGDHGFDMTLSARIPEVIETCLAGWMDRWLASCGLSRPDVRSWAIHPGGPRILGAAEKSLALPAGATAVSRDVLTHHGNMSSATMAFVLERLMKDGAPLPCVAVAFGPGLSIEATLFRS